MLIVPHAASLAGAALVRRHSGPYGRRNPARRTKVIKWSAAASPSVPRPLSLNFGFNIQVEHVIAFASGLATMGLMVADTQSLMGSKIPPVGSGATRSFPILLGPAHTTSFNASSGGGRGKAWLAFVGAVFAMGMAGAGAVVASRGGSGSGARAGSSSRAASSSSSGRGSSSRNANANSGRGGQRGNNNTNRLPVHGSPHPWPPPPPARPSSISTSSHAARPIRPRNKRPTRRTPSDPDPPPGGSSTSQDVDDGESGAEKLFKGVFLGLFISVCAKLARGRKPEDEDFFAEDNDQDEDEEAKEDEPKIEQVTTTDLIVHPNVKEYRFDFVNPTSTAADLISIDELVGITGLIDIVDMDMDTLVDALVDDAHSPAPICTLPSVPSTLLVASKAKVNTTNTNTSTSLLSPPSSSTSTSTAIARTPTPTRIPKSKRRLRRILNATTLITVLWIGYLAFLCWRVVYRALCRVVRGVVWGVQRVYGMVVRGEGCESLDEDGPLSSGDDEDDNGGGAGGGGHGGGGGGAPRRGGGWYGYDSDIPEWSFDFEEDEEDMYGEECVYESSVVEQEEEEDEYASVSEDLEQTEEFTFDYDGFSFGDVVELEGVSYDVDETEEEVYAEEEECNMEQYLPPVEDEEEAVEEDDDFCDMYGDECVYNRRQQPQAAEEEEQPEEDEGVPDSTTPPHPSFSLSALNLSGIPSLMNEHAPFTPYRPTPPRPAPLTFGQQLRLHHLHIRAQHPPTPFTPPSLTRTHADASYNTSTYSTRTPSPFPSPECSTPSSLPSLPSEPSMMRPVYTPPETPEPMPLREPRVRFGRALAPAPAPRTLAMSQPISPPPPPPPLTRRGSTTPGSLGPTSSHAISALASGFQSSNEEEATPRSTRVDAQPLRQAQAHAQPNNTNDEDNNEEEDEGSAVPVHARLEPEPPPSPSRIPLRFSPSPSPLSPRSPEAGPPPLSTRRLAPTHTPASYRAQPPPSRPRPPVTPRSVPLPPSPGSVPPPPSPSPPGDEDAETDTNTNASADETTDTNTNTNTRTIPEGRRRRDRRRKRRGG